MKLLEERILKDGNIKPGGVLKVDSFLNHQCDISLYNEMGKEFHRVFGNDNITKILTIEASGIGIACVTAQYFGVPVVFAKKAKSKNLDGEMLVGSVESFTYGKTYEILVSKKFISPDDRILLIDDFLANGKALIGLSQIVMAAGAIIAGAGICIEKSFQAGSDVIKGMGIKLHSLARIKSMNDDGTIEFMPDDE